ncbi:chemokine XC receptor 1-like [Thunnus albacares]|uniref:chemokine XC receptor 1-like n=1 Tax=Thunnus albacares TaxID=8236 RepID=UPI001CF6D9A3|nr:chemokine XC receptor 1-like [Thunnus albacares]
MAFNSDDYGYAVHYNNSESGFVAHHDEMKSAFHLFSVACCILTFCLSMPGNGFLLWVLLRERAWKTTSDILHVQLTISDLCFTMTLPFWVHTLLHPWIFGDWACKVIVGAFSLGFSSYILFLTAMTLYHYVVVVHTSCLSAYHPRKFSVLVASIVIWLFCAAVSMMESMYSGARDDKLGEIECLYGSHMSFSMVLFAIYIEIVLFVIPLSIITFCYVHMWITIKQCRLSRHHRASRLTLGIAVGFFLCLAPYTIVIFIISLEMLGVLDITANWSQAMHNGLYLIDTLPYFRCCLNPLFYIFGAQRFRRYLPMPCNISSQRRGGSQSQLSLMTDTSVTQQASV